jgi:hypothetical protein
MFIRQGKLEQETNSKKPIIQTQAGKAYQVTHVVAFVWEKLDGQTNLNSINNQIQRFAKDDSQDLSELSQTIVEELLKVGLVKKQVSEANIN